MRLVILFLSSLAFLMGQATIQFSSLPDPPSGYDLDRIYSAGQNVWLSGFLETGDTSTNKRLLAKISGSSYLELGSRGGATSPRRTLWKNEVLWFDFHSMGSSLYMNSQLGIGMDSVQKVQSYVTSIDTSSTRVCVSFGNNGNGRFPINDFRGGWPNNDGLYFWGMSNFGVVDVPTTAIFKLANSSNLGQNCLFTEIFQVPENQRFVQIWRLPDGSYLAERYNFPASSLATEVVLLSPTGNTLQIIASAISKNRSHLSTDVCCEMLVDPNDGYGAVILYQRAGKYLAAFYKNGLKESDITDSFSPARTNITLSGFAGKWAVFTGASLSQKSDALVLLNTETGEQAKVVSGGMVNGVPVQDINQGLATVGTDGLVRFGLKSGLNTKLFEAKVTFSTTNPPPPSPPPPPPPPPEPKPEYQRDGLVSVFFSGQSEIGCKDVGQGAVMSLYGKNFSARTETTITPNWPTSLAGTQVLVNGKPVPLHLVSPGQINLQIPYDVLGSARFQVVAGSLLGPELPLDIKVVAPCFLRLNGEMYRDQSGVMYATGLGQTSPSSLAGAPAPSSPLAWTSSMPEVVIGGGKLKVVFSGLTPGFVGLYQVNTLKE